MILATCNNASLNVVLGLLRSDAALVMLSGQIADGSTTIFAEESDVSIFMIDRYGSFKLWHGAGSVVVAVSFSSIFCGCLPCKIVGYYSSTIRTISYSFFAAIFNVGWATTQVANLSMYAVAFVVFNVNTKVSIIDVENQYRWIAYASIFIGCCFVGVFHLGTAEPRLKREAHEKGYVRISWTYWFSKLLYYQVALVYLLTRLVINVSQSFLAFYVINDLQMAQSSKALVPVIIYICSFIISILLQVALKPKFIEVQRSKIFYSTGGLLWIISGTGILFLPSSMKAFMYVLWGCKCLDNGKRQGKYIRPIFQFDSHALGHKLLHT
ncbi:hypothetical protein ACS0TY_027321 [Phlomoides rotata]